MKNNFAITIATLVIGASLQTSAQTDQGNILVAGTSNLQALNTSNSWKSDVDDGVIEKTFKLNFTPAAGYFVIDNLALGGKLGLTYFSYVKEKGYSYYSSSSVFSPFARYYFGSNMIRPFAELSAGLGSQKKQFIFDNQDDQINSGPLRVAQVSGGIAFFINNNIAFDLGIGYSY